MWKCIRDFKTVFRSGLVYRSRSDMGYHPPGIVVIETLRYSVAFWTDVPIPGYSYRLSDWFVSVEEWREKVIEELLYGD